VGKAGLGYLTAQSWLLLILLLTVVAWWWGRTVLAMCLALLGIAGLLLWRRGRAADPGSSLAALLAFTGAAVLAGTQVVYLKDFLSGGDWYRMNTLFKFFSQAWVVWGIAAALALPRLWDGFLFAMSGASTRRGKLLLSRALWLAGLALLFAASLVFPFWGAPIRIDQRFPGAQPAVGTLNALAYMQVGSYNLPQSETRVDLRYDWEAVQWLLQNVRGNLVIAESSDIDYYRVGGTRAATMTGLSGPLGQHKNEQHYGEEVGARDGLYREFWSTSDSQRMTQLLDALQIGLIYVGQIEQDRHPDAVARLAQIAANGQLQTIYQNERTLIYAVPGRVKKTAQGYEPEG
jgi:uncharacterized membrane protein